MYIFTSGKTKQKRFVFVQSVLPQEDVIALKLKTGESSIKEAISKAVNHYLKCDKKLD
jgi:tRNA(Ser,Leu) C12 N-acetylase TAN1